VHISQLADRFVKDPREVVSPGDRVTVRVLEVKLDKNQIALTMKSERRQERAPGRGEARGDVGRARPETRGQARAQCAAPGSGGGPPARTPFSNPFAALKKLRRP
jgi:uncharacterized protein